MKKLKYLLFFLIIFLAPTTFADEFNMNSYTSATKGGTKNRYRATEIYNTGSSNTYTFGTQYSGRLSDIETYFSYPFSANTTYTLTYNMNTDDFRNRFGSSYWWDCDQDMTNTNATVVSVNYVSYRKVKFTFTTTDATSCIRVWLRSTNVSSTAITGDSNWRLNNITIYDPEWQNGSSSSSGSQGSSPGSSGTSSSNNTDEIINNATENTHTIVDNQNENTQDIINNSNQNTQEIIDSQNEINNSLNTYCKNGPTSFDINTYHFEKGFINSTGSVTSSSNYYSSPYFQIKGDTEYTLRVGAGRSGVYYCIYYGNKNVQACYDYSNLNTIKFTSPVGTNLFLRVTSVVSNGNPIPVEITGPICNNWNLENQNDTNNYLKDDSNPNISDDEFTSLLDSVNISNPLSSLLELPVQFVNAIVNQSNSCQVVNLGTMLGVPITLPCIDIGSIIGSSVWDTIDILSSIGLIVLILKQLYESITNALTLGGYMDAKKSGLGYMSPLEFLCDVLTGFGGDRI